MATQGTSTPPAVADEPGLITVTTRLAASEYAALKRYSMVQGRSMATQLKMWALEKMKELGAVSDGKSSDAA